MGSSGGFGVEEVLRVLSVLQHLGLRTCVAGGWGVDALVGHQTREHRDLDLLVDLTPPSGDRPAPIDPVLAALAPLGYAVETDWWPSRVEVAAPDARWVDLHPLVFDADGAGRQANVGDLPPFRYPPDVFTSGWIGGRRVECLTVAQQLILHRGYPPRPHDLADLEVLTRLTSTD